MSMEKTAEETKRIREMMSAPFDPSEGIQENNEQEQEIKPEKNRSKKIERNNKTIHLSCSLKDNIDIKLLHMAYNSVNSTNYSVSKMIFNVLKEFLDSNPDVKNKYEKLQKLI